VLDSIQRQAQNCLTMMRTTLSAATLFAVAIFANAQQPSTSRAALSEPSAADREQVQAVLKAYESAYQHMSLYELQKIWPDLPNQKKEHRKADDLLNRGDVSSLQVSIDAQDVQVNGDDAVVRGIQHEQYLKTEKSVYYGGDNSMTRVGTTTPGPTPERDKKTVKKTEDVTIHLHRESGAWVIASLEETGKHH
jgi:hypothetical protein